VFQRAAQDSAAAEALRAEVKRQGLKPSSRSRLQHLAVDVAFPRTKVSPSLRTLYAKAIAGGHAREYTAEQFRGAVETGRSGKGGINELARPVHDASRTEPKVTAAEAQKTTAFPDFAPVFAALDGEGERMNGSKRDFDVISLSEGLRQRLTSEGLVDGAEFMVVVKVVGANELQGVEYLGLCDRASAFLPERASHSADFNAPACSQPDALTGPTACLNAVSKEASASATYSQPIPSINAAHESAATQAQHRWSRPSDFIMGLFRVG
jgi:hypothetical protein